MTNIQKIDGMIFDMDGTLLDSMDVWRYAGDWYLETQGRTAEKNLYQVLFTMSMEEGARYLQQQYELSDTIAQITEGINQVIWDFYAQKAILKPQIMDLLEYLKKASVKMTIATATDYPIVEMVLKRLDIFEYFDRIFTCSGLSTNKESPKIFLAAREHMGTPTARTWVAEDALYAIQTAKAAGFPTIGIYDTLSMENQKQIQDLCEIYVDQEQTILEMLTKNKKLFVL